MDEGRYVVSTVHPFAGSPSETNFQQMVWAPGTSKRDTPMGN